MKVKELITITDSKNPKLFVKQITSETDLIDHAKKFYSVLEGGSVPRTSLNNYRVVCSTIFAHTRLTESKHITGGQQFVQLLQRLDQYDSLPIKIGSQIAIINCQLQGDSAELWGFVDPKTITKIYIDPLDHSIKQFEFNNDPNDVFPRVDNAEYNGHFLMYSAFFGDKKSAEQAITMLMLSHSDIGIRNHIKENES
jgi:hypothetical protein